MNKSVFAAFLLTVCFSCNNNSTPSSATVDSTTDADNTSVKNNIANQNQTDTVNKNKADTAKKLFADLNDWEISEEMYLRMKNDYSHCQGDACKIRKSKKYKKALDLIEDHYPPIDWNYVYEKGMYDASDVPRYSKTRKRHNPDHEKVQGHATFILIVSPKNLALNLDEHYFDIFIICPPPNTGTCDLADPVEIEGRK